MIRAPLLSFAILANGSPAEVAVNERWAFNLVG